MTWRSLRRPGCRQTHRDLPASALHVGSAQVRGLHHHTRLKTCISNKTLGGAEAAGLKILCTLFGKPLTFSSRQGKGFYTLILTIIYSNFNVSFQ